MAEDYKSYRIRTNVGGDDNVLHVKLTQTYDTLEVLSLKIDQKNSYKTYKSDYGVVVGRVFANGGYGVPNAKVSAFIPSENTDTLDENILYPFRTVKTLNNDNVRYNLLPDFVDAACHQDVGTFPNKRMVLDNDDVIEVFDKYYTYTTTTNNAGDYMLFGVPTGMNTIHMDVDLSDIGTLSQRPRDFVYKGYNIEQFDSPTTFKKSTNLSSLAQIMSEDKQVYVYSYWGDTSETDEDIAITRCDFELAYKFEPTCVFMGSVVTDTGSNAISGKCTPDVKSGHMSELVAGSGTIEMIRKTFDNKVEQYAVNGNQNIDENGVWCYQIPMNLDYIVTDEFGNVVPSNDSEKGIPTKAKVRFRVSLNEMAGDDKARNRSRYLIPNNPRLDEDRYPEFTKTKEIDYEFGTMTRDEDYCDLSWNNVYTVKNYIPRMQTNSWVKNGKRNFGGIKMISHYGDNNPIPYNQVTTRLSASYRFSCILYKFILYMIKIVNGIFSYVVGGIIGILAAPFCALAKVSILGIKPFGWIFGPVCKAFKKLIPSCIGIDGSICGDYVSHSYTYYIGCGDFSSSLGLGAWTNTKNSHYKNQTQEIKDGDREPDERTIPKLDYDELKNCIETSLGEEYDTISFNFNNDWINGMLYMPLWWRSIRPKRSYLFGLIKKKATDNWCSVDLDYSNKKIQKVQPCAVNLNKDLTNGSAIGCGKKNESCMTAKSVVGFRHGFIQRKQTMLGQDVYYYASCEVDGDGTQVVPDKTPLKEGRDKRFSVKLLFATDIVLLGSLNDNDINGIPQFYKSLDNTTYRMPPAVLQSVNLVNAELDDEGDVSYTQISETEYTGRDWGNSNSDLCDSNEDTSKDGGLFYSIGCSSLRMTPKSCVNASRICEFGVSLDEPTPVITGKINDANDDLSSVTEYIIPDGYISFDEINNAPQRSAFATLNGNHLKTTLNNETGLMEYVFKYLDVDNFDGSLYTLMQSTQSRCAKTQKFNYYLEEKSEGYVKFRLGDKPYFYHKGDRTGNYFPRYENSFYFYFGLKEGKTALDKLNKSYVSDCADTVAAESPVNIFSKGNDWCAFADTDKNGYVAFDLYAIDLPCTILLIGQNDPDGTSEREFTVDTEKVFISSQEYNETTLPTELKGYTQVMENNLPLPMVNNDTYDVYITDDNGDITIAVFRVGSKLMDCVITPSNFETPFNRLMERYNNIYTIMGIREFEEDPVAYTTNVTRKIGGTINISWPKDGDTNEFLKDFVITIRTDDDTIDYNVLVEVHDGNIDTYSQRTVFGGRDSLIYKPMNGSEIDEDSLDGFIFGIPQGDSTYYVEVTQLCLFNDNDEYIQTNNKSKKTVFITDKTQFKLYINDVDYDVIRHWRSGFNVQNVNQYYGTAKIVENGTISDEWFHLSNEDNYHWQESKDYNKIDTALVELTKAKHETYLDLMDNDVLSALYDVLIASIANNDDYIDSVIAENYINNKGGKTYLYYTTSTNSIVQRKLNDIINGLETEIHALADSCITETKDVKDYFDYMALPDYGQASYEMVYADVYNDNNDSYVNIEEYEALGDYLKKELNYYKYEYKHQDSGEIVEHYGYVDLPDSPADIKKRCNANKYVDCIIPNNIPTVANRPLDGPFDKNYEKYIPYTYQVGSIEAQCGQFDGKDVFNEPGYFTVKEWINVENENVVIGNNITDSASCEGHLIYKMSRLADTVINNMPYLGYNTLQYSNKNGEHHDKYVVHTYVKVIDVVEYYKRYGTYVSLCETMPYQYVKLKKGSGGAGYIPYIYLTSRQPNPDFYYFEYYNGIDNNKDGHGNECITYYIKSEPETISVGKLRALIPHWNEDQWTDENNVVNEYPWYGHSHCYELVENDETYLFVPQYLPRDRRSVTKCSAEEFEGLPTYGKHGYNILDGYEKYRNIYVATDVIDRDEYQSLENKLKGKMDYQPHTYLPVRLEIGEADETAYGETFDLSKQRGEGDICENPFVYDYIWNENTEVDNLGEVINHNVYEYADYLQDYYIPNRYAVDGVCGTIKLPTIEVKNTQDNNINETDESSSSDDHDVYDRHSVADTEDNDIKYYGWIKETDSNSIVFTLTKIPVPNNTDVYVIDTDTNNMVVDNNLYVNKYDNGSSYHFVFDMGESEKTSAELETMSPYSKAFYKQFEYRYIIDEEYFSTLDSAMKRKFVKESNTIIVDSDESSSSDEEEQEVITYVYTTTEPLDELDEDGTVYYKNADETIKIKKTETTKVLIYANIIDNTDKITEAEYNNISTNYVIGDYVPYRYEEKVGIFSISGCNDTGAEPIGNYFEDIVAYDNAMIEQIKGAQEVKDNIIVAAKEAFWMSRPDSEHVLTFTAVTEDRPVKYHLVYKQEVAKEEEAEEITYNGLDINDSYICDGTSDISITIPTICDKENVEWGNNCHPIIGYSDLCFARDNSSGTCSTSGASDAYYRKAFFVAAVNAKEEIIPDGTLDTKQIPSNFFGVHVLDKRFINNLVVWPYIKNLPIFSARNWVTPIEINMFGSITGTFKNGATIKNEKISGDNGYYNTFDSQTLDGEYAYDLSIYTDRETIDEDLIGITRYVVAEIDNEEQDVKKNIKEIVNDLENIDIQDLGDINIDNFKPFAHYKIVDGINSLQSVKQCAILTSNEFELAIVDTNNCGVLETINGNLEITLDSSSMNDLRCLKWGYWKVDGKKIFIDGSDQTFIKLDIKNGDVDDFTFYAFEYSITSGVNGDTYPLMNYRSEGVFNIEKINGYQHLYRLSDEYYDPSKPFNNTLADSKYLFGQNANPSFTTTIPSAKYKYTHGQDGKTNNEDVFTSYLIEYHIRYGELTASVASTVGEAPTTNLLYSVNEDVSFQEIINTRNGAVRTIKEEYISSERCGHKSHAHDKWKYYKPQPQGQTLLDGTEITQEEYIEYVGFSRNGEFAINNNYSNYSDDKRFIINDEGELFYSNYDNLIISVKGKDECDENDEGYAAVTYTKTQGRMNTTGCHKPFYFVAISNDGMRRAISPVYDFRLHEILYQRVQVDGNDFYKINIEADKNNNKSYYFYHYDYMVVYDIDFGYTYEDQDTESGDVKIIFVSEVKETGVLQHPAEKTQNIITMDCLIPIPSSDEWLSKGRSNQKIEGTITLTDRVGLKHVFKLNRTNSDISGEGSASSLNTYTFKTNGGVWINSEDNMTYRIPEEYWNTSKDYVVMTLATEPSSIAAWKEDFAKQLKKEVYGVKYEFVTDDDSNFVWDVSGNVYTAKWKFDDSIVEDTVYRITWYWKRETESEDGYSSHDYIIAKEGAYVRFPSSNTVPKWVSKSVTAGGTIQTKTYEFTNQWEIPLASGEINGLINTEDYFIAGDTQYFWGNNSIELRAKYEKYEEATSLTVYFIDDAIVYGNCGDVNGVYVTGCETGTENKYLQTFVYAGTDINEFYRENKNGLSLKDYANNSLYNLIKWTSAEHSDIIEGDNTNVHGIWEYNLTTKAQSDTVTVSYNNGTPDESLSPSEYYIVLKQGEKTYTQHMFVLTGEMFEDTLNIRFSDNETKPSSLIPNIIKIEKVYLNLVGGQECFCFDFSGEISTPTVVYNYKQYKVRSTTYCTITTEDNKTYKITFNGTIPSNNENE